MDVIKGIKALLGGANIAKKELGIPAPSWQFINGMWVPLVGKSENYIDAYKSLSYIYAIIKSIADKSSDAPWQVYREGDSRAAKSFYQLQNGVQGLNAYQMLMRFKDRAFDQVDEHEFIKLLEKPNPLQTMKQLKWELAGYLLLTGNAYLYAATPGIGKNASKPVELWVIPSPCVRIIEGDRVNPIRGYEVSYSTEVIPPEKMIHIKYFNPVTDYIGGQWLYGQSPLEAACSVMGRMRAAEVASGTLFKNMGPPGILSAELLGRDGMNAITEQRATQIKDQLRQQHMGVHNAGDIAVTPAKVSWTNIGLSPVDLKIIEAQDNYLTEICAIFGYPRELFTGSQNVASQGENNRRLVTNCVLPLNRLIDDAITHGVRRWYGDDKLAVLSDNQYYPELQEDTDKLVDWLSKAWWLTVNERRRAMDYDDIDGDGGNVILVGQNMMKLDDAVLDMTDPDPSMLE